MNIGSNEHAFCIEDGFERAGNTGRIFTGQWTTPQELQQRAAPLRAPNTAAAQ